MEQVICHVDMDEFFAAVEKLDNPSLCGKCLLVGGDPSGRGVVSTASYEARKYGCGSAMPMARAIRLCPQAIILPVRAKRYAAISEEIFAIFREFSSLIEPLSIDEAFIDVTGSRRLLGDGPQIARAIKARIRKQLGLTASVGIAPNKFLAKLASDLEKPDGLTVITSQTVHQVLDPLPVRKLWGVGPAVEARLETLRLRTVGQIRRAPQRLLTDRLGQLGQHLHRLSNGLDDRPVVPDSQAKSVGQETTFAVDVEQIGTLRIVLLGQVEQIARRLRSHGLFGRTVTLKLRYGDFTTLTRSCTLDEPVDNTEAIWQAALQLLDAWATTQSQPLRLLGVAVSSLHSRANRQLALFPARGQARAQRLDCALDKIAAKFGDNAVQRGSAKRS